MSKMMWMVVSEVPKLGLGKAGERDKVKWRKGTVYLLERNIKSKRSKRVTFTFGS